MKNIMAKMTGTNTSTKPTPAMIPSFTRETVQAGAPIPPRTASAHRLKGPPAMPSIQSAKGAERSKVSLNTSHMAARKIGIPRKRFRTIRSIFSVSSIVRSSGFFSTSRVRPEARP
jgi:hypothetical protein